MLAGPRVRLTVTLRQARDPPSDPSAMPRDVCTCTTRIWSNIPLTSPAACPSLRKVPMLFRLPVLSAPYRRVADASPHAINKLLTKSRTGFTDLDLGSRDLLQGIKTPLLKSSRSGRNEFRFGSKSHSAGQAAARESSKSDPVICPGPMKRGKDRTKRRDSRDRLRCSATGSSTTFTGTTSMEQHAGGLQYALG